MATVTNIGEQLHLAVISLASGTGTIQERLADAFEGALAVLSPEEFPAELAEDFASVRDEILRHSPANLAANPEWADASARALARKIVFLYTQCAGCEATPTPEG